MLFELVNHIEELLSDVSLISTGTHSLKLKLASIVVISLVIPFGCGWVNIFGELGEFLKGSSIEKVSISLKLRGRILKLSEVNVGLRDDFNDVFSEESDNLKGFLMFLKGLNEHEVSITSLFSEIFSLLVDVVSSVVDPSKVFSGNLNLVFDVLSVSGGFVTNGLVGVGDPGQVRDLFAELGFLGPVDLVSVSLGVNVGLLKVSQESEGAFDGVNGLGLHVQQGGQLASELGSFLRSASGNAQNEER